MAGKKSIGSALKKAIAGNIDTSKVKKSTAEAYARYKGKVKDKPSGKTSDHIFPSGRKAYTSTDERRGIEEGVPLRDRYRIEKERREREEERNRQWNREYVEQKESVARSYADRKKTRRVGEK